MNPVCFCSSIQSLPENIKETYVSQLSVTVTKNLRNSTYKKERLILADDFRDLNPWSLGFVTLGLSRSSPRGESIW